MLCYFSFNRINDCNKFIKKNSQFINVLENSLQTFKINFFLTITPHYEFHLYLHSYFSYNIKEKNNFNF